MKELIKRTKIIWLLVVAISFLGCEDDNDANLPQIVASFAQTINQDTGAVSFLNLSENADSYTWDFGDGTTSTEINPIKSYGTGTYTIILTAENAAGASSTFEDEIIINIPLPINFPVNFDEPNVNYDITTFNGVTFEIVDNPDPSGSNTSTSKVGAITNSGAAFEGFFLDLGMALNLSELKTVKVNFWSDTPIDLLLKLEEGTGADVETTASHGGTGWEMIMFDFNSDASYSRFTLFVDGPGTTVGTFYIDDIEQTETIAPTNGCNDVPVAATSLPLDFEGCSTFPSSDNFGSGITSELAPNPSKAGINTSDFVLKVDKPTNSDFFAGIQNTFENDFDLTTTDVFKLKVYSTKANVVFRFELLANPNDGSIGNPAPVFVTIPNADEWIEVEFTFTGLPAGPTAYNQLVIKPDNDQSDSAITEGGTYYLDDLELIDGGGSGSTEPTVASPTPTQDAANVKSVFSDTYTDIAGTNLDTNWQGDLVSETVTIGGSDAIKYSNVKFIGMQLAGDTDFSDMEFLHVDIWTPDATVLEITPISPPNETLVELAGLQQGQWQSFDIPVGDFTGVDFTKILQFKIDAQKGVNPAIVYMDNLYFYKAGPSGGGCSGTPIAATSLPLDFEGCETFTSSFSSIGDGGVTPSLDANPSKSGINTSDNVLKVVKASGINRWGGVQNSFPAGVIDITTKIFKVKVYSSVADVTYRFELALDPQTDPVTGNPAPQFRQVSGGANEWVELEFTFTNLPASATTYNQLVIKPDNPDGSDGEVTTEERVFYFDDLRLE